LRAHNKVDGAWGKPSFKCIKRKKTYLFLFPSSHLLDSEACSLLTSEPDFKAQQLDRPTRWVITARPIIVSDGARVPVKTNPNLFTAYLAGNPFIHSFIPCRNVKWMPKQLEVVRNGI
jgi:hypothetical protein